MARKKRVIRHQHYLIRTASSTDEYPEFFCGLTRSHQGTLRPHFIFGTGQAWRSSNRHMAEAAIGFLLVTLGQHCVIVQRSFPGKTCKGPIQIPVESDPPLVEMIRTTNQVCIRNGLAVRRPYMPFV